MSEIVQYMAWVVRQFLSRQMDAGDFARNLGAFYAHAREHPDDRPANALASELMSPYAQFSGGFVSEDYLRERLAATIRQFEQSAGGHTQMMAVDTTGRPVDPPDSLR